MVDEKRIIEILQRINNDIDCDINKNKKLKIGLLAGASGISLFKIHLKEIIDMQDNSIDILKRCFININNGETNPYFCGGISGYLYLIEKLMRENYLPADFIDKKDLRVLNTYLEKTFFSALANDNIDFLHGAEGILLYLLNSRLYVYGENLVNGYLKYLELSQTTVSGSSIAFYSWVNSPSDMIKVFNLGMAHGMASTIQILALIYKINDSSLIESRTKTLLEGIVNFYIEQKLLNNICSFPNYINEATNHSRLAWCYGDLSIGIALYNAGIVLNNTSIQNDALEICKKTTYRHDDEDTGIKDAGICHGTSGLTLMYHNLFNISGIDIFKNAKEYWISRTMEFAKFNGGIGGFKTYTRDGYVNELNLLEGSTGIGLVLLSCISDKLFLWDECLLLS